MSICAEVPLNPINQLKAHVGPTAANQYVGTWNNNIVTGSLLSTDFKISGIKLFNQSQNPYLRRSIFFT